MYCKSFWKKTVPFSLTFALGLSLTNFFFQIELPKELSQSKTSTVNSLFSQRKLKNCTPKLKRHDKQVDDYDSNIMLMEEAYKSLAWLTENKNASQKDKEFYQNKLEAAWKRLSPDESEEKRKLYKDEERLLDRLLYIEKCYEF